MTPYELGILLHYYGRASDHEDLERNPPVWRPTIDAFLAQDLLEHVPVAERDLRHPMAYRMKARGRAFCAALQAMPLPKAIWRVEMPVVDDEPHS